MNKNKGFSLIELLISISLSLILINFLIESYAYLLEKKVKLDFQNSVMQNAILGISTLAKDIEQAGFFYNLKKEDLRLDKIKSNQFLARNSFVKNDCYTVGLNDSTFIKSDEKFIIFTAQNVSQSLTFNCIKNANKNTLAFHFKGLSTKKTSYFENDLVYFNSDNLSFFDKYNQETSLSDNNFHYLHSVYYIKNSSMDGTLVPSLYKVQLKTNQNFSYITKPQAGPIASGIENMNMIFGLDTNFDQQIDTYKDATDMTKFDWKNSTILNIDLYLLARSYKKDKGYKNTNTYILGVKKITVNDNYHRALIYRNINLINF